MKYAERLAANGLVDQTDIAQHVVRFDASQRFQTDTYILKGGPREDWSSRFAYDGFRYVEVRGFPGKPDKDSVSAIFFHSDVPAAGHFECSQSVVESHRRRRATVLPWQSSRHSDRLSPSRKKRLDR